MGLYRRGKTFWFNIMYEGRRYQESLKTDNRKLAEKLYAKIFMEIVEGSHFEKAFAKTVHFGEMAEKYLAEHGHWRDPYSIKKLSSVFKGFCLSEITPRVIADYRKKRLETVKPATVYQELALLRRMFNVAIREWEWLKENPASKLSFSVGNKNARDRWLTVEEEKELLTCATNPQWLRRLLVVALHTGMRKGEIRNLRWQDIDFTRRIITVVKSKNGEKRTIPMSNHASRFLKDAKVRDISGKVFPVSETRLRVVFMKTLKKAGISNFRFHDLRHTFATRLVQNGVDLYKVKELLGHKTLSMTTRYAHHYPESLRASVEVLDNCYNFTTFDVGSIDK